MGLNPTKPVNFYKFNDLSNVEIISTSKMQSVFYTRVNLFIVRYLLYYIFMQGMTVVLIVTL